MTLRLWVPFGVAALPCIVFAQDPFAPPDRERLQPQGVRAGGFVLLPSVKLSEEYNDNFLQAENNSQDTFITRLRPELEVRSTFSRHAISVVAGTEIAWYHSSSDDDYVDFFARGRGQIDVTRDARINVGLGFLAGNESRGADDSPTGAKEPTPFNRYDISLSGDYVSGVFRFNPFLDARRFDYSDVDLIGGGRSDESFRDRWRVEGGLEVGYEFLRGYEAFARGSYYNIDYDNSLPSGGPNRDGTGVRGLTGVNFGLTRLIEGSVGVGFENRNFDGAQFKDYTDFVANADLFWSVTPLTTIRASVARELAETTVANASHRVLTGATLGVQHDLRRNIILEAAVGVQRDDFQDISRKDDQFTVGFGVEWLPRRDVAIEAQYRFTTEDSNAPGQSFDVNQFFVSARYVF